MDPSERNLIKIEIQGGLYVDKSICYYQIEAKPGSLDTWANRYKWVVQLQHLASAVATIGFGGDLRTADRVTTVSRANQFFEFDADESKVFLSFEG